MARRPSSSCPWCSSAAARSSPSCCAAAKLLATGAGASVATQPLRMRRDTALGPEAREAQRGGVGGAERGQSVWSSLRRPGCALQERRSALCAREVQPFQGSAPDCAKQSLPHPTTGAPVPPRRSAGAGRGPAAALECNRTQHGGTRQAAQWRALPLLWPRCCLGTLAQRVLQQHQARQRCAHHTTARHPSRPSPHHCTQPTWLGACSTIFTLSSVMATFCSRLFTTPLASAARRDSRAGVGRGAQAAEPGGGGAGAAARPAHATQCRSLCSKGPRSCTHVVPAARAPALAVTSL